MYISGANSGTGNAYVVVQAEKARMSSMVKCFMTRRPAPWYVDEVVMSGRRPA